MPKSFSRALAALSVFALTSGPVIFTAQAKRFDRITRSNLSIPESENRPSTPRTRAGHSKSGKSSESRHDRILACSVVPNEAKPADGDATVLESAVAPAPAFEVSPSGSLIRIEAAQVETHFDCRPLPFDATAPPETL